MKKYRVLSGTWYEVIAENEEQARQTYQLFWDMKKLPENCTMEEQECDSIWEEVN